MFKAGTREPHIFLYKKVQFLRRGRDKTLKASQRNHLFFIPRIKQKYFLCVISYKQNPQFLLSTSNIYEMFWYVNFKKVYKLSNV